MILKTYYVSPNGTDSGKGSRQSPISLAKANSIAKPRDGFILLSGIYHTSIKPAVSGAKGKPIVYKAAEAANPVLSGLDTAIIFH